MRFAGRGILLDIEGTTSSIHFVYDVMFPFVRRELAEFLRQHWDQPELQATCERLAQDAGFISAAAWLGQPGTEPTPEHADRFTQSDSEAAAKLAQTKVAAHVLELMDQDVKATGLKQLQGFIWESGFASGELKAHLYPDVRPALQVWQQAGIDLRIYSSGSITAQKLFFGHTVEGNLLALFRGHYDTTIGSKKESDSYRQIATEFGVPAEQLLFLSDAVAELDAARRAGFQTGLVQRPGNAPLPPHVTHPVISSFAEIELA